MPPNTITPVTLELTAWTLRQLDELADARGATRERVLAGLIDVAHKARSEELTTDAPLEITLRAKQDLLHILQRDESPANLDYADNLLHAACIDALKAEREGRRSPTRLDSGALRYRGPKPQRLTLVVHDGALVSVTAPRGGR